MSNRIRNHASQPLELHLAGGTVILGPHDLMEVDEELEANAQLAALRDRGLLAWERVAPAEAAEPGPEPGRTNRAGKARPKKTEKEG